MSQLNGEHRIFGLLTSTAHHFLLFATHSRPYCQLSNLFLRFGDFKLQFPDLVGVQTFPVTKLLNVTMFHVLEFLVESNYFVHEFL